MSAANTATTDLHGLIIDSFAGGGGASTGIEMAFGRSPDIAINHDAQALAMHEANHPDTEHFVSDIWAVNPIEATRGQPVAFAWFSPDCKHFSKAKGSKPVKRHIRDLAWVVIKWARLVRPAVIALENVEEFRDWGPLGTDKKPCPRRKGQTFRHWVEALRRIGYEVDWWELRACDYGAPTIRKRLVLVARCDGGPITKPEPTHGRPDDPRVIAGDLQPHRTAAEIIDWSIPCPSIFLTSDDARELRQSHGIQIKRPLAENTMRRIAQGVVRYVLEDPDPFLVVCNHSGDSFRGQDFGAPMATITANRDAHGLVMPYFVPRYGERDGQEPRTRKVTDPLPVIVPTANGASLIAPFLAQHNTGVVGHDARTPVSTIVQRATTQAVVAPHLVSLKGSDRRMQPVDAPAPTICAGGGHAAAVAAFLVKYYGTDQRGSITDPAATVTTRDRFGLVTVSIAGEQWILADIGMRMLTTRELFRAQGFRDSYIIDHGPDGSPLSLTAQRRMCGNSVCPDLASAVAAANRPRKRGAVAHQSPDQLELGVA